MKVGSHKATLKWSRVSVSAETQPQTNAKRGPRAFKQAEKICCNCPARLSVRANIPAAATANTYWLIWEYQEEEHLMKFCSISSESWRSDLSQTQSCLPDSLPSDMITTFNDIWLLRNGWLTNYKYIEENFEIYSVNGCRICFQIKHFYSPSPSNLFNSFYKAWEIRFGKNQAGPFSFSHLGWDALLSLYYAMFSSPVSF